MNPLSSVMRADASVSVLGFAQTRMDYQLLRRIRQRLGTWQHPSKDLLLTLLDHAVNRR